MQNIVSSASGRVLRSARRCESQSVPRAKAFAACVPKDLNVEHDPVKQEFSICMGEECAVIQYAKFGDVLDLYHTEVPVVFRGQGVAAVLAKEAFQYVQQNNLKMQLSCEYLQKYFKENQTPELKKIVV